MKESQALLRELVAMGDLRTQSWLNDDLTRIQESNDITHEDYVVGNLSF